MTEQGVNEILKKVIVGDKVRVTFKDNAPKNKLGQIALLKRSFSFDLEWFLLVVMCVSTSGQWEGISRTQEFTLVKMVGADREVCANILAGIVESVELL